MKKRDAILDFTSLLDVTLIVIFFFVLFSTLDAQANQKKVDDAVNQYNVATKEANDKAKEYDESIDIVKNTTEVRNKKGVVDFNSGMNLKIIISLSDEEDEEQKKKWDVTLSRGKDAIYKFKGEQDVSKEIIKFIQESGYDEKDTILCDLVMNMKKEGSNHAYVELQKSLDDVKNTYHHLYVSETDLSIAEE